MSNEFPVIYDIFNNSIEACNFIIRNESEKRTNFFVAAFDQNVKNVNITEEIIEKDKRVSVEL